MLAIGTRTSSSNCSQLGSLSVTVTTHLTFNACRSVKSESELLNVDESEILENLRRETVSAVKRITIRREGKVINTVLLILTFDSPSLPSHIRAGYLNCPVRPYRILYLLESDIFNCNRDRQSGREGIP